MNNKECRAYNQIFRRKRQSGHFGCITGRDRYFHRGSKYPGIFSSQYALIFLLTQTPQFFLSVLFFHINIYCLYILSLLTALPVLSYLVFKRLQHSEALEGEGWGLGSVGDWEGICDNEVGVVSHRKEISIKMNRYKNIKK